LQNVVWTFSLFWYSIYDNFDCAYAFNYSYILLYNLAFTSLPVILMGILDQDVSDKVSLAVPQLYRRGIERKEWTEKKFWLYMLDGLYQSVICFFFGYLNFRPATFNSETGRDINDFQRMGVFVACPAVVIVNSYILLNTYRWDWFLLLVTVISSLLIFFWTGVYTSFTAGFTFQGSGAEVYGALSFWCNFFLTVIVALMPRFAIKSFQKIYMPRDVDIVREQIRQGRFDYLKNVEPDSVSPAAEKVTLDSGSDSETSKSRKQAPEMSEDQRPIYPPSVSHTATTHTHTANGSDSTEYTQHRESLDRAFPFVGGKTDHSKPPNLTTPMPPAVTTGDEFDAPTTPTPATPSRLRPSFEARPSYDRPRPSYDRVRSSMDRVRPSYEASNDFTSAAYLTRVESSQSGHSRGPAYTHAPSRSRVDITQDLRSSDDR